MASIELTMDQRQLLALTRRLQAQADGKQLRRQLANNMRRVLAPVVSEVKSKASAMKREHTSSEKAAKYQGPEAGRSLGSAIAQGVGTRARMSGPLIGISVRASKRGMPRNFRNAPKRMNQESFRHPVYGRKNWVVQVGIPGYFDATLSRHKEEYRLAVMAALRDMAARIAK